MGAGAGVARRPVDAHGRTETRRARALRRCGSSRSAPSRRAAAGRIASGGRRAGGPWGQEVGPAVIVEVRHHAVLGIRLLPAGAYALFGAASARDGLVVELEDLVGAAARSLVDRCRTATSVQARFRIAATWLAE